MSLPVEVYKGKPIFYGLCNLSFNTGHGGRVHGDWIGMLVRIALERKARCTGATFQFMRHNDMNETFVMSYCNDEAEALAEIVEASATSARSSSATATRSRIELAA